MTDAMNNNFQIISSFKSEKEPCLSELRGEACNIDIEPLAMNRLQVMSMKVIACR
jgi:hypothetical protein